MPRAASAKQAAAAKAAPVAEPAQEQPVQQTPQKEQVAEGHSGKAWQVHGGEIRIQIFAPHTTAVCQLAPYEPQSTECASQENEKIIRVSEVHNETQTSVYGSQGEVQQQHAYDTSPHAGEHHAQARSTLIGGTIIIEVHNETSLKVFPPADASASGQQQANDHTLHEGEGNAQVDVVTGHKVSRCDMQLAAKLRLTARRKSQPSRQAPHTDIRPTQGQKDKMHRRKRSRSEVTWQCGGRETRVIHPVVMCCRIELDQKFKQSATS